MVKFDITILTDSRYVNPTKLNDYVSNVLLEDQLLKEALESKGLKVYRTNWDDNQFDWSTTRFVIFRTTWDYFDRYQEFSEWLSFVSTKTNLINSEELIRWNVDKHYLNQLYQNGVNIPPTCFIEKGEKRSLFEIAAQFNWNEFILKPVVSGAARHTYRFEKPTEELSQLFATLIQDEAFMIQEFQQQIVSKGEVAYMVFGGKFSHAVLKTAKQGDFRVQDDFGGTISDYFPSKEEIAFIEDVFQKIAPTPVYARIDVIWDNNDKLSVGEVELIEPELWFRRNTNSSKALAEAVIDYINP